MTVSLSDHFSYQKLLRFVAPSILMMIVTSIYSIVDGFFVSNFVGKNPFAALNLIFPVIMALAAFGFMIGTGGSALIAKTLGEGKKDEANGIFSMLVVVLAVGGAILSGTCILLLRPISYAVGATELTIDDCMLYGRVLLISLPFFMLQNSFQSFLATAEKPHFGLRVTVFAGLTNMVLDFLLVYVFPFGLLGAALATAFSQIVGALIPLVYFLRPNDSPLRLTRPRLDLRALGKACYNGSSEMVSNLSTSLVGVLYNIQLMAIAQENGVSAYGVIMYVSFIFMAFFFGLVYCARLPHRPHFRRLRRRALQDDGQRAAPLCALVPRLRLQYLRLGVFHRPQQRHGQRAHLVSAHARPSGRRRAAPAGAARDRWHLACHHCGRSAHPARHRGALPRGAQKVSLRLMPFMRNTESDGLFRILLIWYLQRKREPN